MINVPLSGNSGTGFFAGSNQPTINQPLIVGVTNGSDAAAGDVGEIITSNVPIGSAGSLTNNTPGNCTSISLMAGRWVIFGNVWFGITGVSTYAQAWASLASATQPDLSLCAGVQTGTAGSVGMHIPFLIINLSSPNVVYLSGVCGFSTGTAGISGSIFALRIG